MSGTDEIKERIRERIKEMDQMARGTVEKLKGQAQETQDRLLDKTYSLYEQMLVKAENKIRSHREKVHTREFQEEIIRHIREKLEKLDPETLSAKAVEALTLEITSDLTALWYNRDYMERKLKEGKEEKK